MGRLGILGLGNPTLGRWGILDFGYPVFGRWGTVDLGNTILGKGIIDFGNLFLEGGESTILEI